jgi:hypothetical protein
MTDPQLDATDLSVPDARAEAAQRAASCGRELAEVLKKHRCRIVPYLLPLEPVGHEGSRALVQASYGVIPDA